MRTIALTLLVLLAACFRPSLTSAGFCTITVQFSDPQARSNFVRVNAAAAVDGVRAERTYLQTDDAGRNILIVTPNPSCTGVSSAAVVGLQQTEGRLIDARVMDEQTIVRRLSPRGDWSDDDRRQCVVVLPIKAPRIGYLMTTLPYVGLRKPQVMGAGSDLYLGVDEDCGLARDVSLIAAQQLDAIDGGEVRTCPNASFNDCGIQASSIARR